MRRKSISAIFVAASLLLMVCQALAFYAAFQVRAFLETNQIVTPQVNLGVALAYFLGVAALTGLVLFLLRRVRLKTALKTLFAFLFTWGTFIFFSFFLPLAAAVGIALALGILWFFRTRVWLHDLLLVLTLASAGAVFGAVLMPWTAMLLLLALSVYDVLAVRFGYMQWLASRMSESDSIPVFVIPRHLADWELNMQEASFKKLSETAPAQRELSILGGGDIGLPLLLIISVFFTLGFANALVVAAFSLLGLLGAFVIQIYLLKGRAMPALPPISFASLIGFLIASYLIPH